MAEDNQDESQKTEDPTHKRLQESRDKGQVAKSQETTHWFMLLALAILIGFFAPSMGNGIVSALRVFVEKPHAILVDPGNLQIVLGNTIKAIGLALLVPVVIVIAAAIGGTMLQIGLIFSADNMKPKLEKLSVLKGFKRQFSLRALVDFVKGIFKLVIVASVIALVLWPEREILTTITTFEIKTFLLLVQSLGFRVLIAALAAMTVIAGLDFLFQKYQHIKKLRMSKQDIKDEFKQTEGDPMIKARLRQIRTERARQRMMSAVPEADVVVTNPSHYAVALKYVVGGIEAPRVTAKGVDNIALKIREVAEEHDVPIVENPPLARALYGGVEIDQEIPPEHYKAVAEIIGYVMRLNGKMPRAKAPG